MCSPTEEFKEIGGIQWSRLWMCFKRAEGDFCIIFYIHLLLTRPEDLKFSLHKIRILMKMK